MSKVIIYGLGDMAEIAHYYLTNDSEHEVAAFCIKGKVLPKEKYFKDLPIIPFEKVEAQYSIVQYKFFAPMSSEKMNTHREEVYYSIKKKGYQMISYVSSKSVIYNSKIGENCFIQAGNILHPLLKLEIT